MQYRKSNGLLLFVFISKEHLHIEFTLIAVCVWFCLREILVNSFSVGLVLLSTLCAFERFLKWKKP